MSCVANRFWAVKKLRQLILVAVLAMLAHSPVLAVQSVMLSWNPSGVDGVAGYKIYCGGASQVYTNVTDAGNLTNVTISGLLEGSTNYFSATTYDASTNESAHSDEVMFVTPAGSSTGVTNVQIGVLPTNPPVLNMVDGLVLTANPTDSNSVIVSWNATQDTNATGYFLYFGTNSLNYPNIIDAGLTTNITIFGLASGCTNYFNITEYDVATNQSPYTNEVMFVTPAPVSTVITNIVISLPSNPPVLNMVAGLTVAANPTNANSVMVSWNASQDANAAGYFLYYGTNSLNYPNVVDAGTATNFTISGLPSGCTNYFTVTEYDVDTNQSPYSNEVTFVTAPALPVLHMVGGLMVLANPTNAGSVILSWNASSDAGVNGYQIFSGTISGSYSQSQNVGLVTNLVVTGLVPGSTNFFSIREFDAAWNQSDVSAEVQWLLALPVNVPPTLNALGNLNLNINALQQNVVLSGITAGSATEKQTLKVTAKSSNLALIPNPTVSYVSPHTSGNLSFKPGNNQTGTATITVTVNDGGTTNNTITRTFTVTVVNQALMAALPRISKQIKGGKMLHGKRVTLSVAVSGQAPFKYQWKFNGVNLPGATAATLTINKLLYGNAGSYSVKVFNNAGSTNSAEAQLVVVTNAMPVISTPVQGSGQFSFQISGVDGYKYVVAATTDMMNWTPVQTNTAPFTYTETNASGYAQRFYRSYYLP